MSKDPSKKANDDPYLKVIRDELDYDRVLINSDDLWSFVATCLLRSARVSRGIQRTRSAGASASPNGPASSRRSLKLSSTRQSPK